MPKSPYSCVYQCGKCKSGNVKLWRGIHGAPNKDGHELLCATCLTDKTVDAVGRAHSKLLGRLTNQVADWLPAIPTNDTFWGYGSAPLDDFMWWVMLPTYSSSGPHDREAHLLGVIEYLTSEIRTSNATYEWMSKQLGQARRDLADEEAKVWELERSSSTSYDKG